MLVKKYKGYEINVDKKGEFSAVIDGEVSKSTFLSGLEQTIDSFKKKTFKRLKAIELNYQDEPEKVTITSVTYNGSTSYRPYKARITNKNKSSSQIDLTDLIKPTPDNIALIKKIKEMKDKSKKLDQKISDTKDKIKYFKPEDVGFEPEVEDDE